MKLLVPEKTPLNPISKHPVNIPKYKLIFPLKIFENKDLIIPFILG